MKNTLEGTKSRLDDAEEQISDLEDTVEMTQFEQWMEKHKDSLKNVWNSIKHIDVCIIVGKRERGRNVHEEILVENLPNIMNEIHNSRKHRVPNEINLKDSHGTFGNSSQTLWWMQKNPEYNPGMQMIQLAR